MLKAIRDRFQLVDATNWPVRRDQTKAKEWEAFDTKHAHTYFNQEERPFHEGFKEVQPDVFLYSQDETPAVKKREIKRNTKFQFSHKRR